MSTQVCGGAGALWLQLDSDARKDLDFTRECDVRLFHHHLVYATVVQQPSLNRAEEKMVLELTSFPCPALCLALNGFGCGCAGVQWASSGVPGALAFAGGHPPM